MCAIPACGTVLHGPSAFPMVRRRLSRRVASVVATALRVCSQRAKRVLDGTEDVRGLLASNLLVAAIVAPSFPAEFVHIAPDVVAGMIRAMGFRFVVEAAFGADLVAWQYRRLMNESPETRYISTTCPAVIGFVERYLPHLVPHLAPIVSPMIATARALRKLHGPDLKIVFIGPCIAKKGEAASEPVCDEINGVLTFREAREMMNGMGITPQALARDPERGYRRHEVSNDLTLDFDPPHPGTGALFAISRGLLQAAGLTENLLSNDVVATDGRREFVEALNAFDKGSLRPRVLEVLCCEGCIMGAGMTSEDPMFQRRQHVSEYVRDRITEMDMDKWETELAEFEDLDLSRTFQENDQRQQSPTMTELRAILERMGKRTLEDELNCGACGYVTCAEHAIAIYKGRAESEMCLPFTIDAVAARDQGTGKRAGSAGAFREVGEHGPTVRRYCARGEQPHRHRADVYLPFAGRAACRFHLPGRCGDDCRAGRTVQNDCRGTAELFAAKQDHAKADECGGVDRAAGTRHHVTTECAAERGTLSG